MEHEGSRRRGPAVRDWSVDQRHDDLALAQRGCDPTVAAPLLDFSTGSALCREGRADSRPVRKDLERSATQGRRVVLSADEKTSIQARSRKHKTLPTQPGAAMRLEHEYKRCGAWAYLAALDVHRAKLFGRCERKNGIAPFDRLVDDVMRQAPYNDARRVFWIVDNGSAHRAPGCITRLRRKYPRLTPVHGPIHASWLNQIEIYFLHCPKEGPGAQRLRLPRRSAPASPWIPEAL
jgi:hypothetical protein